MKNNNFINEQSSVKTLSKLYHSSSEIFSNRAACAKRIGKEQWEALTYSELYSRGQTLASYFLSKGVKYGDKIALFSDNREEWYIIDCAIQIIGAVVVPRGADITEHEVGYILPHSEANIVIVENEKVLAKVEQSIDDLSSYEIVVIDKGTLSDSQTQEYSTVMNEFQHKKNDYLSEINTRLDGVKEDDLFTIIYTSGTTGTSKGVMLTHKNIISQAKNIPIDFMQEDRILTILPIWHAFERAIHIKALKSGGCYYYSSRTRFAEDLKEVQPTFMASVPRLWDILYQKTLKRISRLHPMRRLLFTMAVFFSKHFRESSRFLMGKTWKGRPHNPVLWLILMVYHSVKWFLLLPHFGFFNAAVMESVRMGMGGCFKGSISGGGALSEDVDYFFNNVGVRVLEGYGLTETSPVLAVRYFGNIVLQTVGPTIPETEFRIKRLTDSKIIYSNKSGEPKLLNEQGELWVRGPQIMTGYFKEQEKTNEVLKDGWFNTGDLALMTAPGSIRIVGRSKDTIVLLNGENIEPQPLENAICQSPLIDQCFVYGQDRAHLGVLVVPDKEGFVEKNITLSLEKLAKDERVTGMIKEEIRKKINTKNGFRPFETPRALVVLGNPFEVGKELTSTLKPKRHVIVDLYNDLIESSYLK